MNTKDAVRVVWHYKNVEAALKIYTDARKAESVAYQSVDPGEDEFVTVTLNGREHYMIQVDMGGDGCHKVRRLAATTEGDGNRPPGYEVMTEYEYRMTDHYRESYGHHQPTQPGDPTRH